MPSQPWRMYQCETHVVRTQYMLKYDLNIETRPLSVWKERKGKGWVKLGGGGGALRCCEEEKNSSFFHWVSVGFLVCYRVLQRTSISTNIKVFQHTVYLSALMQKYCVTVLISFNKYQGISTQRLSIGIHAKTLFCSPQCKNHCPCSKLYCLFVSPRFSVPLISNLQPSLVCWWSCLWQPN